MFDIRKFIVASFKELTERVAWPTFRSSQNSTVLVIVSSIVFAIIVGFMDVGFRRIITSIYNYF